MVKIQCRVVETKFGKVPDALKAWQDTEHMPPLHDQDDAKAWLKTNRADELTQYGIEFQIVEIEASTPAPVPGVTDEQMSQHVS